LKLNEEGNREKTYDVAGMGGTGLDMSDEGLALYDWKVKHTSIWFIAGVTFAVFMIASKCCGKKFETPIDFALPDACTSSIAFQAP